MPAAPKTPINNNNRAADQAAAWFARQRSTAWSEAEAARFAAWLKADPANTSAWASYERLWNGLESVRDNPRILVIREQACRSVARRKALQRTYASAVAVAASVLVALGGGWIASSIMLSSRLPALVAALSPGNKPLAHIRDATTGVGERSILVLEDGSKITLNTASAVHADYTDRERRVTLVRGEAFFDVARDPTRAFVVSAGPRHVSALGTAFDVRLQDRQIKVTLVEGKVRVTRSSNATTAASSSAPQSSPVVLEPGSALIVQDDGTDRVQHLDAVRATSWTSGKLIFDGDPLSEVVAEMNRYSQQRLEIADPALNTRKVSGVFDPTRAAAFAKALEGYGIARVTQQTPTKITLASPF